MDKMSQLKEELKLTETGREFYITSMSEPQKHSQLLPTLPITNMNNNVKPYVETNVIHIPEGATNGDMVKTIFPNLEVEIEGNNITCWIDEHRWIAFDYDWWFAQYKENK